MLSNIFCVPVGPIHILLLHFVARIGSFQNSDCIYLQGFWLELKFILYPLCLKRVVRGPYHILAISLEPWT